MHESLLAIDIPCQTISHQSDTGGWEMVSRPPHPRLRNYVVGDYCGWTETGSVFTARREVATAMSALILNFGSPYLVADPGQPITKAGIYGSFAAGLSDVSAIAQSLGPALALQVNFTPAGAYAFYGCAMSGLTNQVIAFESLLGADANRLVDKLHTQTRWEDRFAILDNAIWERISKTAPVSKSVAWAFHELRRTDGAMPIGQLSDKLGCSPRRLIAEFQDQIGLAPKKIARIMRFERVMQQTEKCETICWGEIALECGYYDQSHFIRDFTAFSGITPQEFLAMRLPGNGGLAYNQ